MSKEPDKGVEAVVAYKDSRGTIHKTRELALKAEFEKRLRKKYGSNYNGPYEYRLAKMLDSIYRDPEGVMEIIKEVLEQKECG